MADRAAQAQAFLDAAGWSGTGRVPLAGDASARRYERLTASDGRSAVLMDAPPDKGQDVRPFVAIGRHLAGLGLAPPAILAADEDRGFLLIEDLGDGLFARVLRHDPEAEQPLYAAATDVLVALHRHPPPPGVPAYDAATMPEMTTPAFDWYLRGATGATLVAAERAGFVAAMGAVLRRHATAAAPVLLLRDYHAENLIWRPDRTGLARVGLLDFQDACAGHPAFDLVSLLEDARRDVAEATRAACLARYAAATATPPGTLGAALAVLGAQRNLRILGVFARLSLHFGKPHYVDLIPRVWGHLLRDLSHPAAAPLRPFAARLPGPAPATLDRLKELCGTVPTP